MTYTFQWGVLTEWGPYMAAGMWYTIVVSFWSIVASTVIGVLLASMQMSKNKAVRATALVYVDIFRTLPLLCLLIWIHYVLSVIIHFSFSPVQSAILSLSPIAPISVLNSPRERWASAPTR